jgi:hypothetical protein
VSCRLQGDFQNCDLLVAVSTETCRGNVKAGENHGAKLSHINVVSIIFEIAGQKKKWIS